MFSYREYADIMRLVKASGRQKNFKEALETESYIIMRHDVEFSVERAYELACLERKNDFRSTYFFQLSNNAYNLLSRKNLDYLEQIHEMGHTVGLHFHLNGLSDRNQIEDEIQKEIDIVNAKVSFCVDSFSFHRPTAQVLEYNIKIPGLINAYQDDFFSYVKDMEKETPEIKYLSDARHRWNYGLTPNEKVLTENRRVQILTHPYSWTECGYDNLNNFRSLYKEKCQEILETFDAECKHFGEIKDEL
jgi:hypothetical protein